MSLLSLTNFFKNFDAKIFKAEKINTHGGSIRVFISKDKKRKIESSVKKLLKEEENFGLKKYQTYVDFGKKVYLIRKNVLNNLNVLRKKNKNIIKYGAPAKATTALNFFGITDQIDFIVEDNSLKHNKYIPGVNIPIKDKKSVKIIIIQWLYWRGIF